jgi:hypothetical protein
VEIKHDDYLPPELSTEKRDTASVDDVSKSGTPQIDTNDETAEIILLPVNSEPFNPPKRKSAELEHQNQFTQNTQEL